MKNEPLAKLLCHSLCCLIQSAFELGIGATFWGNNQPDQTSVLHTATDDSIGAFAWL